MRTVTAEVSRVQAHAKIDLRWLTGRNTTRDFHWEMWFTPLNKDINLWICAFYWQTRLAASHVAFRVYGVMDSNLLMQGRERHMKPNDLVSCQRGVLIDGPFSPTAASQTPAAEAKEWLSWMGTRHVRACFIIAEGVLRMRGQPTSCQCGTSQQSHHRKPPCFCIMTDQRQITAITSARGRLLLVISARLRPGC